jgi:hypothetical protein
MEYGSLADTICKRMKDLEKDRDLWMDVWQDLARYNMPRKDTFYERVTQGEANDEWIYDSTPTHALELLASALGGLLTNPAMPWFTIVARSKEKAKSAEVRKFLEDARDEMLSIFNDEDTGFQQRVHEVYLDVALFGTACYYVESDKQNVARFETVPMSQIRVAEDFFGRVDSVYRETEWTVAQVCDEWGEDKVSDATRRKYWDGKLDEKVKVVHAVYPRKNPKETKEGTVPAAKDMPIAGVYLEKESKHVLEESGYLEMPYMVPRWSRLSGEVYGRGPGLTALSDVRVLHAMARTSLMAGEKMADPPLMVPDDGFLGPVRTGPAGLTYYRAGSTDRIEPLPIAIDLSAAEAMMEQRRQSIRRIYLGDMLQPEGPALTATEALIRQKEKMRVVGPVMGRLQTEFLAPLTERVFGIQSRNPDSVMAKMPQELVGQKWGVEYKSPIANLQREQEALGFQEAMMALGPLIGESDPFGIMDNFDPDKIARSVTGIYGVPDSWLRPEEEVAAKRQADAQAMAQANAGQEAQQLVDAAGTLGGIQTDGGSNMANDVAKQIQEGQGEQ